MKLVFIKPDLVEFREDFLPEDFKRFIQLAENADSIAVPVIGKWRWKIDEFFARELQSGFLKNEFRK